MNLIRKNLQSICRTIGYDGFMDKEDIDVLLLAFTTKGHSSLHGGNNNEILEHLGDAMLGAVVTNALVKEFGYQKEVCKNPRIKADEGTYSEMKSALVNKLNLARRIDELGLAKYLSLGKDYKRMSDDDFNRNVKEDLFEAIIGAVCIDCKFNYEIVKKCIYQMLNMPLYLRQLSYSLHRFIKELRKVKLTLTKSNARQVYCTLVGRYLIPTPLIDYTYDVLEKSHPHHYVFKLQKYNIEINVSMKDKRDALHKVLYLGLVAYFDKFDL